MNPQIQHEITAPVRIPGTPFEVSAFTNIGGRRTQEDRFTICPSLGTIGASGFALFDGTAGDFAAENAKRLVFGYLVRTAGWNEFEALQKNTKDPRGRAKWMKEKACLDSAMNDMFVRSDVELMHLCGAEGIHYAASTGVCAVVTREHLAVGHLGDSRICLLTQDCGLVDQSRMSTSNISGEFLTIDHKPDQLPERRRIERCGGSVEYLHNHNNKPFIRGGDFAVRKAMQEQPMQLQYSRAFGGKDLKMYGLSNVPDVTVLPFESNFRAIILASDGLWDVYSAQEAAVIAQAARAAGESPAKALVKAAIIEQDNRRVSSDNVTVICVYFLDDQT